jgi:hypothetical protein
MTVIVMQGSVHVLGCATIHAAAATFHPNSVTSLGGSLCAVHQVAVLCCAVNVLLLLLLQVADEWVELLFPAQKETQLQRLADMHDTRKAIAVCHNWWVAAVTLCSSCRTCASEPLHAPATLSWISTS